VGAARDDTRPWRVCGQVFISISICKERRHDAARWRRARRAQVAKSPRIEVGSPEKMWLAMRSGYGGKIRRGRIFGVCARTHL
jgi:hypothetical protein